MSKTLETFKEYLDKMKQYNHAVTVLYWDMKTCAPKNGFAGHTDALTFFSTEEFRMSTSEELSQMLDALSTPEEYEKLDDTWKYIVTRMKRDMDKNKKIPEDVYAKFIKAHAESGNAWAEAKNASDYSICFLTDLFS